MAIHPLGMTRSLLLTIAIEIVSFPNNSMVICHTYVSSPEGSDRKFQQILRICPLGAAAAQLRMIFQDVCLKMMQIPLKDKP